MSQEFTEEMEKALLNLRKEIVESLASEDEDFKSLVSSMGIKDDGDAASDDMMIKKIEALNQIAANRLKSVDAAPGPDQESSVRDVPPVWNKDP